MDLERDLSPAVEEPEPAWGDEDAAPRADSLWLARARSFASRSEPHDAAGLAQPPTPVQAEPQAAASVPDAGRAEAPRDDVSWFVRPQPPATTEAVERACEEVREALPPVPGVPTSDDASWFTPADRATDVADAPPQSEEPRSAAAPYEFPPAWFPVPEQVADVTPVDEPAPHTTERSEALERFEAGAPLLEVDADESVDVPAPEAVAVAGECSFEPAREVHAWFPSPTAFLHTLETEAAAVLSDETSPVADASEAPVQASLVEADVLHETTPEVEDAPAADLQPVVDFAAACDDAPRADVSAAVARWRDAQVRSLDAWAAAATRSIDAWPGAAIVNDAAVVVHAEPCADAVEDPRTDGVDESYEDVSVAPHPVAEEPAPVLAAVEMSSSVADATAVVEQPDGDEEFCPQPVLEEPAPIVAAVEMSSSVADAAAVVEQPDGDEEPSAQPVSEEPVLAATVVERPDGDEHFGPDAAIEQPVLVAEPSEDMPTPVGPPVEQAPAVPAVAPARVRPARRARRVGMLAAAIVGAVAIVGTMLVPKLSSMQPQAFAPAASTHVTPPPAKVPAVKPAVVPAAANVVPVAQAAAPVTAAAVPAAVPVAAAVAPASTAVAAPVPPAVAPVAAAVAPPAPAWRENREWTGGRKKSIAFEVPAEAPVRLWMRQVTPLLVVRCLGGTLDAFVVTQSASAIEPGRTDHTVHLVFDGEPEVVERWTDSAEHDGLFAPDGRAVVAHAARAARLRFTFRPHNAPPAAASFVVTGTDELQPTLTKYCK